MQEFKEDMSDMIVRTRQLWIATRERPFGSHLSHLSQKHEELGVMWYALVRVWLRKTHGIHSVRSTLQMNVVSSNDSLINCTVLISFEGIVH